MTRVARLTSMTRAATVAWVTNVTRVTSVNRMLESSGFWVEEGDQSDQGDWVDQGGQREQDDHIIYNFLHFIIFLLVFITTNEIGNP